MNVSPATLVLAAIAIGSAGCDLRDHSSSHSHPHPHPHPHSADEAGSHAEPHAAQFTIWSHGYEAFIEHEYPVAKNPVEFITHVSELATGEPRREGAVTFEFTSSSGESFEHTAENVVRDGIYLPSIRFPSAGSWQASLRIPSESGEVRLRLPDVVVYTNEQDAWNAEPPDEVEGVSFLKEQQWPLAMRTESAAKRQLRSSRVYPGRVRAIPGRRVTLSSPVAGRLIASAETPFPARGRSVAAGEPLALVQPTLPSSDVLELATKIAEADAAEQQAQAKLELAKKTLARVAELAKTGASSPREHEQAQFAVEAAERARDAAKSIRGAYESARRFVETYRASDEKAGDANFAPVPIAAPISGTVVEVHRSPGEHVGPASSIFAVLDGSRVQVEARVPESSITELGVAPRASIELPSGKRAPLSLVYAGLEVDASTRTVPLVYEVENGEGFLRIGLAVEVAIEIDEPAEAIAIPESALVEEDGRYVAFVQLAGETFERRPVVLGRRDGGYVEVKRGVAEGERVASTDAWTIRLASLATSVPSHGHSH